MKIRFLYKTTNFQSGQEVEVEWVKINYNTNTALVRFLNGSEQTYNLYEIEFVEDHLN